ncbi:TetR/AcrR family transcriptional regulator [Pseudomonas matsuisoli]|uniref:TetR family transcriptional regulator n=1 Tax=Pseudomonas matsuisoli TaxID=1515666 RepID=A0A917Q4B8_9PSED|nr:TetR/AcrR family transcriptional regulator [Pseudomonas matsuisoli]GGK08671.1 TetR family transcriptional regulator [Pseudomonas matsuisoli]
MTTKELKQVERKPRGRPRAFDTETALDTGQRLFHTSGYESVGLAALTDALGVKPPSFYKAFGSKAEFFSLVLDRYARSVLTLDDILLPGRAPVDAMAALLESAASTYARDPHQRGCLVLEAVRGLQDDESVLYARKIADSRRVQIREFIAQTHPECAAAATDYVASTLSGLSASAREGMNEARLLRVAEVAVAGLRQLLQPEGRDVTD